MPINKLISEMNDLTLLQYWLPKVHVLLLFEENKKGANLAPFSTNASRHP